MVLVMDVGNTNIKIGVFDQMNIVASWRVGTDLNKTSDEYGIVLRMLFAANHMTFRDITGSIISSVIPSLNYTLEHMIEYYVGAKPLVVGPGIKTGINIKYDNPKELGSDRIINALAAYKKYGGNLIIIDFGTSTTFNVVNDKAEFLGGAIAPGVKLSTEALSVRCAKLPKVELSVPKSVIGRSTVSNIQSGIIYGYIGLVKNIVDEIRKEAGFEQVKVIATGGISELFAANSDTIEIVDRKLSLIGLKMIYDINVTEER